MDAMVEASQRRIQAALERIDHLSDAEVAAHVAIYDQLHNLLQEALTTVDQGEQNFPEPSRQQG